MAEVIGTVVTTDEVGIRDVRSYIAGATFPTSADTLYNIAVQNGANQYIRAAVGELSAGIYNSEGDVIREMTRLGYV